MKFNITIDSKMVEVNNGMSILQACELVNVLVPRFCYHERLSVAGNCRMCLVEIEKAPKLVASCAMPVMPNMAIHTNSLAVKKAREGVLEFLLVNHPLDCVICDQGGECDLQDQTLVFGSDRSRFREHKRAVEDKQCGPLIKTIMTRCIHCTRCVRFANEIIGLPDLGTSGRGNVLEISLYVKKLFKSEFSGNIIDLCPVGALTSKTYSFTYRPWEFKSVESIDVCDAVGSNIRIDTRGYDVMRILPRLNESINEEWISDKARFSFDGLKKQRIYSPLFKLVEDNKSSWVAINWAEAIFIACEHIYSKDSTKIGFIGANANIDSIALLQELIYNCNGFFVDANKNNASSSDFQVNYRFNATIANVEHADLCLLLGVNPRVEAPILNLRLRKRYIAGGFKILSFNSAVNLTYPVYNLGISAKKFLQFVKGEHSFSAIFAAAKNPIIIVGKSFFSLFGEQESHSLLNILVKNTNVKKNNWFGLSYLYAEVSEPNTKALGISQMCSVDLPVSDLIISENKSIADSLLGELLPQKKVVLYCLGDTNFLATHRKGFEFKFVIYQGSFLTEQVLKSSNLILPTPTYVEENAGFLNIEGLYQETNAALNPPVGVKSGVSIIESIINYEYFFDLFRENLMATSTPVENIKSVTILKYLESTKENKNEFHFSQFASYLKQKKRFLPGFGFNNLISVSQFVGKTSYISSTKIENFYISDTLSEVSNTMAKCSAVLLNKSPFQNIKVRL